MAPSADKHYQARILERRDISPDLWILRVDPGGPFEFRAGQYATLGIEQDGKRTERAYSIVSSPYEDSLEFFFELVPQGDLTPDLSRLNEGDTLLCRKIAKGRFTLDLRSGRSNHLLVSTVTGIAPFVSYVRTLCAGGPVVRIYTHGEPPVGRSGLERRAGPRGRCAAKIYRRMGLGAGGDVGLSVRPSHHDREQPKHPETGRMEERCVV